MYGKQVRWDYSTDLPKLAEFTVQTQEQHLRPFSGLKSIIVRSRVIIDKHKL